MFCNQCGNQNPETSVFCNRCGQSLSSTTQPETPVQVAAPAPNVDPALAQTDSKAVASLVLGIFSLFIFSVVAGVPAIILGHISRSNIKKSMGRLKGEGMALAGLIMGYLSFAAIPFILIIAAIAIPNLLRARMAANEARAVGSIRTINTAAVTYAATYGQGYSTTLESMGGSESSPSANHAGLIDNALSSGTRHGYRFTYEAQDSNGDHIPVHYFVLAVPVQPSTGRRSFCSDESGIIRYELNTACTASSPALE